MEIETKKTVEQRYVLDNATAESNGKAVQQPKCGECDLVASHSVTDAVEFAPGEWRESEPRYGCRRHTQRSLVKYLNGKTITWEDFVRGELK